MFFLTKPLSEKQKEIPVIATLPLQDTSISESDDL